MPKFIHHPPSFTESGIIEYDCGDRFLNGYGMTESAAKADHLRRVELQRKLNEVKDAKEQATKAETTSRSEGHVRHKQNDNGQYRLDLGI